MIKKTLALLLIICIIFIAPFSLGQIQVGVKVGDWIQYEISTTGTPIEGHNIVSARLEIIEVQGTAIKANVTSTADNGTVSSVVRNFNLQEGNIQAWVIIPANLGAGDSFYDATIQGNITIQDEAQKTFAGATRTITHVNTPQRDKQWDKTTGIFVTTQDYLENYTVSAKAVATNMWSPQILGFDQPIFYAIAVAIVVGVIIAFVAALLFIRRKSRHSSHTS